ncbi:hypothetical protein ACFSC6_03015 [Rufibacter sediminis]|uniref:Uncharacterized protein n=1 Tax=Rufibacter sediminis TaxID=2762756 RepID=A0ABR6VVZ6_9BACT|nr:hypothetical protein [Rufibacter sediminis]MBC3541125.1 hypothetical protein [Rufibacter sediminis]
MELREEIVQQLQDILEDLETYTTDHQDAVPAILVSLRETEQILQEVQKGFGGQAAHQRVEFLTKMLHTAKEEIEAGGVQDGLWFGKSVITFLLNGTSAGAVPVETEEYD